MPDKRTNEITAEQKIQKQRFDKKIITGHQFKPGNGTSKKFLPKYVGPMQIKKVLVNDRFLVVVIKGTQPSAPAPYESVIALHKMKSWRPAGGVSDELGNAHESYGASEK